MVLKAVSRWRLNRPIVETMDDVERSWLARARRFDPRALGEIYDAFNPALFRYGCRLLGDTHASEDLVSETFYRLLVALRSGGGPQRYLRAYLFRVAHNLAMDRHRKDRFTALDLDLSDLQLAAPDDPSLQAEESLLQSRARSALWQLTSDQRQVILLKYYEGLDNDEVAAALNKPVGAVKALQHRAVNALRRILSPAEHQTELTP